MKTALLWTLLLFQAQITEEAIKKAETTLALNPDDAGAHLTLGKYLCFQKDDWIVGLPHLAKGSDATLKSVASKELAEPPKTAPEQIGMGDVWLEAIRKLPALRRPLQDRAVHWYAQAWLTVDGVWKDKEREQLRKLLQNPNVPDPRTPAAPGAWKTIDATQKCGPTTKAAKTGKTSFQVVGTKNPANEYVSLEQNLTPVAGKYEFSAWVLSDGTDSAKDQVSAAWFAQGAKLLGYTTLIAPQDNPWWRKLETTFEVPAGAVLLVIHVHPCSKAGNFFVDDVSVKFGEKELLKNGGFEDK